MPDENPTPSLPVSSQESTLPAESTSSMAEINDFLDKMPTPGKPTTPAATPSPTSPPVNPTQLPAPDAESVIDKVVAVKQPRNYDGLDEREKKIFSSMANESYEVLFPLYKKAKALGDLDKIAEERDTLTKRASELEKSRYFDHPEAYTLAEDYRELSTINNTINQHLDFYANQLANAEGGKPVQFIVKDGNGKFVLTAAAEPTPQLKAEITRRMQKLTVDSSGVSQTLGELQHQYKTRFSQHETTVKDIVEKLFGKHKAILQPTADKELAKFPSYVRNRPEYQGIAYALAAMQHLLHAKRQQESSAQAQAIVNSASQTSGPTTTQLAVGANGKPAKYSDAEYKELMMS